MLAIRLQRTGRTGHAQFRVIVQDSRFSPKRGRVVAYGGSYDPHTKIASLHTDIISSYLDKGAQPSDRVARLLKKEGVKLPKWVSLAEPKKRAVRNPDKLRRNRPPVEQTSEDSTEQAPEAKAPKTAAQAETEATEPTEESAPAESEVPTDTQAPETAPETAIEETQSDIPAEEAKAPEADLSSETPVKTEAAQEQAAEVKTPDSSEASAADEVPMGEEKPATDKPSTEAEKED